MNTGSALCPTAVRILDLMASLLLAALCFDGIHFGISGTRLRDWLVARMGPGVYQAFFSLLSLAAISWLCTAYARAPMEPLFAPLPGSRWIALVGVLFALIFVVVGVGTPSPTAAGGEKALREGNAVKGILKITRHPFLWGAALWAFVHLISNGDLASTIFFGAFLVLSLVGTRSIDRKRARSLGELWEPFAAATSNVPFAKLASGLDMPGLREIGVGKIALAVAIYLLALALHPWLFGVSPLPLS